MREKVVLWSPDTCRCSVFFTYDGDLPLEEQIFSYITQPDAQAMANRVRDGQGEPRNVQPPEVICPVHVGLGSTSRLYGTLQDENTRKNISIGVATGVKPTLTAEEVLWAFDSGRVLHLSFDRENMPTPREKIDIGAAVNIQFGPGKVVVS